MAQVAARVCTVSFQKIGRPLRAKQKKNPKPLSILGFRNFFVGVPGLEPGKAGPESAVLPLHHTPNLVFKTHLFRIAGAKVVFFSELAKFLSTFL